jgi:hypothetical protein
MTYTLFFNYHHFAPENFPTPSKFAFQEIQAEKQKTWATHANLAL